jgi:hypothetical protein
MNPDNTNITNNNINNDPIVNNNYSVESHCNNKPTSKDNKDFEEINLPKTDMICNNIVNPNLVLSISNKNNKQVKNFECKTNQVKTTTPKNLVISLSTHPIDVYTTKILEKGLNFAIPPHKIPIEYILCSIENSIKNLSDNVKEEIRQDCSVILRRVKPPKNKITKEEFLALKSLNNNKNLVVLKANKGGVIVVTNKENYIEKMLDLINNNGSYKKFNKKPLNKMAK